MKAVLVVAGLGTRMLPINKTVPKEMLPVGDKPVIQYTVESLVDAGIKDIIMITSQQKKALEDYFDKNYELEDILEKKGKTDLLALIKKPSEMANYSFVRQTQILGTAHAVLQVKPWMNDNFFMVIFADAIYPPRMFADIMENFAKNKKPLIVAHEVPMEETYKYGVLKLEGEKIVGIVEKPKSNPPSNLVCNGVYLLPKEIFPIIETLSPDPERGEYQLPDALNILMKQMDVNVLKTDPFWDVGSIDQLMKANNKLFVDGKLFD